MAAIERPLRFLACLAAATQLGAAAPPPASADLSAGPVCHVSAGDDPAPPAEALLPGNGTGGFPIRTASREAQAYFDNGMQLAHAFAHAPAISAFRRAERLDPTCAMCLWGEAWARGPTLNYTIDAKGQAEALALADRAAVLAADGPPRERALIAALRARYRNGGGGGPGDYAFARAMDDLARAYPADSEIAVMAADAWMLPAVHHNDHARLARAMELLEGVLRRDPDDTGAIHFYIHATEMSGVGARALPYAQRLRALAPAASHLVHMPSHTFFWVGLYRQAEAANIEAARLDDIDAGRMKPKGGVFDLPYHGHNLQYGLGGAMMDGDAQGALDLAGRELARLPDIKPGAGWAQMGLAAGYFAYGRYASQAQVAALADPGGALPFARAMWRYARGEAAARRGDTAGVTALAGAIDLTPAQLKGLGDFASRARAMTAVAREVLAGRAAMMEGRFADAESAYRRAAETQETKLRDLSDPPAWWYPVRRSLAAALEAEGKSDQARAEARKVLARWIDDPVTLAILGESERRAGKADDTRRLAAIDKTPWAEDLSQTPSALR